MMKNIWRIIHTTIEEVKEVRLNNKNIVVTSYLITYFNYLNFMKYIYFQMTMEGMTQVTNAKIQR